MHAKRATGDLSSPGANGWSETETTTVTLSPIPLDDQPTEYIRTAWANRPYGTVQDVQVAAAHDGTRLFVRLEWADSETPNTEFADAAAVFFPVNGDAPVATLGSESAPVNLWYWQADRDAALDLESQGPGRFRDRRDATSVQAEANLDDGRWSLVLSRELLVSEGAANCGVAVWDGSNEERAGIGAVTGTWIPLEVEDAS